MSYKRTISQKFVDDLMCGVLSPLLDRIKEDDTLMLALRDDYINIYYRGGNLLKVEQKSSGNYSATFNTHYNKNELHLPEFPFKIGTQENCKEIVDSVLVLKYAMDRYFSEIRNSEREFQQLVVRENNCSPVSSDTEYFIVDIEVAKAVPGAKFDMLAVRWLREDRSKKPDTLVPVLIEMKYGSNALKGKAGLAKHLRDADFLVNIEDPKWKNLLLGLQEQVNQLDELGLLEFNRNRHLKNGAKIEIDLSAKPELIFILANNHPGTSALSEFLGDVSNSFVANPEYELLFYAAGFAGYAMHRACMLNLGEFQAMVVRLYESAIRKTS
jgi:hypothetical protein